jgi:hypothetical protein
MMGIEMLLRFRPRHQRVVEKFARNVLARSHALAFPAHHQQFPPILLNTLPKSGSKYILRSLQRILQIDDIRILGGGLTRAGLHEPSFLRFIKGNLICQEHLPAEPHIVASLEMRAPRMVLHVRDPRAALVSWVHHVNTINSKGHIVAILQGVECRLPDDYFNRSVVDQLAWQVDHFLPTTSNWISRWMDIAHSGSSGLQIMVTNYTDLASDGRALLSRILDFYQIKYQPDWIKLPKPETGKWNYRAGKTVDWRDAYPPALLERATSMIAERERNHFGWH